MNRRSWVEWLALGLIVVAVGIPFVGSYFLGLPHRSDDPGMAALRHGLAPLAAVFMAGQVAAVGSSLYLVKPLLRLGPRAPLWLIPLAGAVLGVGVVIGEDRVCRPFERDFPLACPLSLEVLCPILIVLGTVLLIRKAQLSRMREPDAVVQRSS